MKRWLLGLSCLLFSGCLLADTPDVARQHAVGSMLVGGWIELTPSGSVKSYALDNAATLPAAVTQLLGMTVPHWTFEPVRLDGKPVIARSRMSLRVDAVPAGDRQYRIGLTGAEFTGAAGDVGTRTDDIRIKHQIEMMYPKEASDAGVYGTVYVLMMINWQGKVEHALAEQVDLATAVSDKRSAAHWRDVLAKAALQGTTRFSFQPPTTGPEATSPYWLVRIPVNYLPQGVRPAANGSWSVYIPGPVETAAWIKALADADKNELARARPDATPSGELVSLAHGLHMTSKLGRT